MCDKVYVQVHRMIPVLQVIRLFDVERMEKEYKFFLFTDVFF